MKKIFNCRKYIILCLIIGITFSQEAVSQIAETTEEVSSKDTTSLFDYIYQMDGRPKIRIETNVKKLICGKMNEAYQSASFQLNDTFGNQNLYLEGRMRARGNIRKSVSYLPPVKFDFKKPELDSLGFLKLDKLKFVFPKNSKKYSEEKLFKEFFLYDLYEMIDSSSIRTKLVEVTMIHKGKKKYDFVAFLIEDEEEYARRKEAKVIEKGKVIAPALDRISYLKMVFFQYMIANTDYSVSNRHNLEIVKLPHTERVVAVPYDFDYSGFVGQKYAIPHTAFPIKDIHERYLFPAYRITENEYDFMADYFLSIEEEIYALCDKASYMDERNIRENKSYLKGFFKLLRKPERVKEDLIKDYK